MHSCKTLCTLLLHYTLTFNFLKEHSFISELLTLELYLLLLPPLPGATSESCKVGTLHSSTSTTFPSTFYGRHGHKEGDLSLHRAQNLSGKPSTLVRVAVGLRTQTQTELQGSGYGTPPCRSLRGFRGIHRNLKGFRRNILQMLRSGCPWRGG